MRHEETATYERDVEGLVLSDEDLKHLEIRETYAEQVDESVELPLNFYILNDFKQKVGKGRLLRKISVGDSYNGSSHILIEYLVTDLFYHRGDSVAILPSQK